MVFSFNTPFHSPLSKLLTCRPTSWARAQRTCFDVTEGRSDRGKEEMMDGMREVRWAREVGVRSIVCSRVAKWSETVGCDWAFDLERRKEATRGMCWRSRVASRKERGEDGRRRRKRDTRREQRRGRHGPFRSFQPPTRSCATCSTDISLSEGEEDNHARLFYILATVQRHITPSSLLSLLPLPFDLVIVVPEIKRIWKPTPPPQPNPPPLPFRPTLHLYSLRLKRESLADRGGAAVASGGDRACGGEDSVPRDCWILKISKGCRPKGASC